MQSLPDSVRIDEGRGGLGRLLVQTALAEAEIYLHGGHVTHFQPRGQKPVLFLSGKSWFETGRPIRGGVPICFPWFGPRHDGRTGPAHGFARLREWEFTGAEQGNDGSVEIGLQLASDETTRKEWDGDFKVNYRVRIGATLGMKLCVQNTSRHPIRIEEALHTYLAVSDVRQVNIEGLAGVAYSSEVETPHANIQGPAPIRIIAETDRAYANTRSPCVVDDPGWKRRLMVEKTGSDSTVVWNPWVMKAKRMPDFDNDEWPFMLCIETCNIGENAVTIAPGQEHVMGATISAKELYL